MRQLPLVLVSFALLGLGLASADAQRGADAFRQLDELLPTANAYRTASGAPGHAYWQQKVDYDIEVEIDDDEQRLIGSERIRYHNRSPDELAWLWIQLDPNVYAPESHANLTETAPDLEGEPTFSRVRSLLTDFDGGLELHAVRDADGAPLAHTVVDTMMRIDLPEPLASGGEFSFSIDWSYPVNEHRLVRGRTGYEYFEEDGNHLYQIAQWFPRLAAYTDSRGWQNKQFLGAGEFALEFGDYRVAITVPADHVVAATGVLRNPEEVLTPVQRERLARAATSDRPVLVVTPEEAEANETSRSDEKKTWVFEADSVRDFAFATSRKFIWDAVLHPVEGGDPAWAMSYWPKEGEPLWSRYSTHAVMHALDVYSRHAFPYPYPVAISVNGPVGGMEYPMICFNGPRPEADGTYSERTKYHLISVVLHEVGHNWFPMIVNSDERQWTWMDEGLDTFVQFIAEQEWEDGYPSRRGEPKEIVDYMTSERQVPVMTGSESILQFGSNAYAKPATALNVLRETVMGRELFDFAFREYSRRWMFKRPEPGDFFRTMEDASAIDLDWFWRGWFYGTEHVDVAIEGLTRYTIDTRDPDVEKERRRRERDAEPTTLSAARNAGVTKRTERFPELLDFYDEYDELDVTPEDRRRFADLLERLEGEDKALLANETNFYVVDLRNVGGLVTPVVLDVEYRDGSREEIRVPAEIWRKDAERVRRLIPTDREIASLRLDPRLETADADPANDHWPPRVEERRFRMKEREERGNPMREAAAREEAAKAASGAGGGDAASGTGTEGP